jgi:hypothetical protein
MVLGLLSIFLTFLVAILSQPNLSYPYLQILKYAKNTCYEQLLGFFFFVSEKEKKVFAPGANSRSLISSPHESPP